VFTLSPVTAQDTPQQGGTLRIGYNGRTSNSHFCALMRRGGAEEIYSRRLPAAKLLAYNADYSGWVPDLAEGWEFSEDGMTLTVTLREGLTWHDGAPLTAEDVEFTYTMMLMPEIENWGSVIMRQIEGMEEMWTNPDLEITPETKVPGVTAIDERTVEFRLTAAFAPEIVLSPIGETSVIIPKHILGEYLESRAKAITVCQSDWATRNYVGSGPFRVVEYTPDQQIIYEAYEDYHFGRPPIDRVIFIPYQDRQTMLAALQAQEIDVAPIEAEDLESLSQLDFLRFSENPFGGSTLIMVNNREGAPTHDVRVRQAMMHAIDRQTMAEVYYGTDRADSLYQVVGFGGVPSDIQTYDYDPDRARELLAEAQADGTWDSTRPFRFAVTEIPSGKSGDIYAFLFDSLAQVGMQAEFEIVDSIVPGCYYDHPETCDGWFQGYNGGMLPNIPVNAFLQMCDGDISGYCNEDLMTQWRGIDTVRDPEEFNAVWADVQRTIAEEVPWIYLTLVKARYAVNTRVQGPFQPSNLWWHGNHWDWEQIWLDPQ
jgi:peptide/nickel transport system substrate-binding protein